MSEFVRVTVHTVDGGEVKLLSVPREQADVLVAELGDPYREVLTLSTGDTDWHVLRRSVTRVDIHRDDVRRRG